MTENPPLTASLTQPFLRRSVPSEGFFIWKRSPEQNQNCFFFYPDDLERNPQTRDQAIKARKRQNALALAPLIALTWGSQTGGRDPWGGAGE